VYYIRADWYGQMAVDLEDFLLSASKISENIRYITEIITQINVIM